MSDRPVRDPISSLNPGAELGVSSWITITQQMIDHFGEVTLDPDPMHVDAPWAKAHSPFGSTIAFGFLTISLLTHMLHDVMKSPVKGDIDQRGYYLNYGFDRLRLISPVPEGSRVRGHFGLARRDQDERGRWLARFNCEVEVEGQDKPALVAEWLSLWVPPAAME